MAKDPSKTEKATGKRRQKARKEGDVLKSTEIISFLTFTGIFLGIMFYGGTTLKKLMEMITFYYSKPEFFLTDVGLRKLVIDSQIKFFIIVGPYLAIVLAMVFIGNLSQVGFLYTTKPLEPKLEKLNPVKGFKKIMFSVKTISELTKTLLKVIVITYVCYKAIAPLFSDLPPLPEISLPFIIKVLFQMLTRVFTFSALVFLAIAIIDWGFQKYQYEEKLKMTKQEIKDEVKDTEGDPKIKQKRMMKMFQMSQQRMMQAVPTADVVITNPTHYAVALKYEDDMPSPKVVAKGKGYVAKKIKDIAAEHNIPMFEDKPLARALYKLVDIDQYIPEQLFKAVAEILAYVYKLDESKRRVS